MRQPRDFHCLKILAATITNYRSIGHVEIDFSQGCQALIGINESGKSNILRALSHLDPSRPTSANDVRLERADDELITKSEIVFKVELTDDELKEVERRFVPLFDDEALSFALADYPLPPARLNLAELCRLHRFGVIILDVLTGGRVVSASESAEPFALVPGWVYNASGGEVIVEQDDKGTSRTLAAGAAAYLPLVTSNGVLKALSQEQVVSALWSTMSAVMEAAVPQCVFWKFSESDVLPGSINIDEFARDPSICKPLLSIFELAGHSSADLSKTIAGIRGGPLTRYWTFLERIEQQATNYIRAIWRDHPSIRIHLRPSSHELAVTVTDDSLKIDMGSRSDGFKRFVSFMLQVSARVKLKQLQSALLLVDEPETGLHPDAARALMRELIQIGITNKVVYSTHSIFMVDRSNVDRHLIVERENDLTTARRADRSRLQDEEVLYAAMGYSIFESIGRRNVVFEGWRDREIFRIAAAARSTNGTDIENGLADIGVTFADGAKDIKNVARLLELGNRACLIISDADGPSLEKRAEYTKHPSWGTWITLQDILGPDGPESGEDLIVRAKLIEGANRYAATKALPPLSEGDWKTPAEPSQVVLKRWLSALRLNKADGERELALLKGEIFTNLRRSDLTDDVDRIVDAVLAHDFQTTR